MFFPMFSKQMLQMTNESPKKAVQVAPLAVRKVNICSAFLVTLTQTKQFHNHI
jgi:hypothetical protein